MDVTSHEYVLYLRKSKGRAGIGKQRTTTTAHLARIGGRIVAEFPDADRTAFAKVGADRPDREKFTAMLAYLAAHPGTRVAAWHCDRISRNGDDAADLIRGGYYIVTPHGDYDLSTATGRKRFKNDITDAEYEVDHLIERLTERKAEHRAEGRWLGGRRPFGWSIDADSPGRLVLHPAEAAAVDQAARDILKGRTTHAIAREWNESGTLTSTRRRWAPTEVRRVLTRETNWAPPPAQWPPLVDADTHRALCGILTDPARRNTPGPEVAHLLSGLIRCGMCWTPMITTSTKRETSRLVYRCRNGQTGKEGGDHVARSVPSLDAYVTEVVIARFELNAAQFLATPAESPLAKLQAQRDLITQAMKASNDLRRAGLLTDAEFAAERGDHMRAAAQLDARITAARSADQMADMTINPQQAWKDRDLGQRRDVIRRVAEIVIIPQPKGRPKGWKPGQPYLDTDTVVFGWKRA